MGWGEFTRWIRAMNRELQEAQVSPDSWDGADNDSWWVNARRERHEQKHGSG